MPNVAVPSWYFLKRVKSDYSDWKQALTREFFQNSRDAGATEFKMGLWGENGLYVYDDGCGMDRNGLLNKLLVLGEGQKPDGAVGGFGLAKELLFFSWPEWHIFTNDLYVKGSSGNYDTPSDPFQSEVIHEADNLGFNPPFQAGTLIMIQLPEDIVARQLLTHAYTYLQECETKVTCYIENAQIITSIKRGRKVRELSWGAIHHRKGHNNHMAIIRASGVKMFERQIGSGLGEIVVEISKRSTEVLTANRDGLNSNYESEFDAFLSEIARDRRSALKDKKQNRYFKLQGAGEIDLTPTLTKRTEQFRSASKHVAVSDDITQAINEIKKAAPDVYKAYAESPPEVATIKEVSRRLEFLGYNPHFWVKCRSSGKPPAWVQAFLKKRKAKLFAHLWTAIVKQVLLDNGIYIRFVAGFTFEDDEEAEYAKLEGKHVFLLNPRKNISSKKWQLVWQELRERAIHEIAHRRFPFHDEEFIEEMDKLRRNCWMNEEAYKKLYFEARELFPTKRASRK